MKRVTNWIMLALHLIGIFLSVLFWYIIDDPGFGPTEFTIIGLSFHIIFLLFTIWLMTKDLTIFDFVFGNLSMYEWMVLIARGAVMILIIFALAGPYIDVFRYANFCNHKEEVVIESVEYEGITNGNDGKDYINFSLEVSIGEYEVNQIVVHTLVYKGDKFVGYIQTYFKGNLSRPHKNSDAGKYFEAESRQTLKFSIEHTRGYSFDGEELFKELYYGDPEEFTFVPNIISVDYYDGITVGNHFGITDYYDENGQIHFAED